VLQSEGLDWWIRGLAAPIPDESGATADQQISEGYIQQDAGRSGGEGEGISGGRQKAGKAVAAFVVKGDPVNKEIEGEPGDPGQDASGAVGEQEEEAEQGGEHGECPEQVSE
jgi:hypothetical protein